MVYAPKLYAKHIQVLNSVRRNMRENKLKEKRIRVPRIILLSFSLSIPFHQTLQNSDATLIHMQSRSSPPNDRGSFLLSSQTLTLLQQLINLLTNANIQFSQLIFPCLAPISI